MTGCLPTIPRSRRFPARLPSLETRRLVLRPPQRRDAMAIASALGDFAVARMLPRVPFPFFRQDAHDWLSGMREGVGANGFAFAVVLDDEMVGVVGFDRAENGFRLFYWLARSYWGQGLMSEAVSAALIWAFDAGAAAVVESGVLADNPASLALQRRLGFQVTGLEEMFTLARNACVNRIETRLAKADFRPAAGGVPAAYRHVV